MQSGGVILYVMIGVVVGAKKNHMVNVIYRRMNNMSKIYFTRVVVRAGVSCGEGKEIYSIMNIGVW